jgi:hypothetical protein
MRLSIIDEEEVEESVMPTADGGRKMTLKKKLLE